MVEPCIAATPKKRVVVNFSQHGSGLSNWSCRRAISSNQSSAWRSIVIPGSWGQVIGVDPSIAPEIDANGQYTDKFIIAALRRAGPHKITVCHYDAASNVFSSWEDIGSYQDPTADPPNLDKPWIVSADDGRFYVVYIDNTIFPGGGFGYALQRWDDSAETWFSNGKPIKVEGTPVAGWFCAQPAISRNGGPLYVAYALTTPRPERVRFLESTDLEQAEFQYLVDCCGTPVELTITNAPADLQIHWPYGTLLAKPVPYQDVDSDSNDPDDVDVNMYCAALTKKSCQSHPTCSGNQGAWFLGTPIQVATCNAPDLDGRRPDQFCPAAAVDSHGRVHVIFYDNRDEECANPGSAPYGDEYDVYYAISAHDQDGTITGFTNFNLRTGGPSQERPLRPDLLESAAVEAWSPREYNGLGIYDDEGITYVWAAYSGTSSDDQPAEPNLPWDDSHTVIYSQRIKITN